MPEIARLAIKGAKSDDRKVAELYLVQDDHDVDICFNDEGGNQHMIAYISGGSGKLHIMDDLPEGYFNLNGDNQITVVK